MTLEFRHTLLIGDDWVAGEGEAFAKHDPIGGDLIWQGRAASPAQVERAVAVARAAFPAWARRSFDERVAIAEAFRERLEHHREQLAHTIAQETGKPLWEARTEVTAMIGKVAISIKAYHDRTGERAKDIPGGQAVLRHRPHGVLAVFGPYNFPGHLPNGHIVPALLAGNTLVFKPSELTPATADLIVQCWQEAGLPPGALNLVQGAVEVGQALSQAADIDGLLFTGSATTGKLLHKQFAGQVGKILALELGGNNPLVIKEGFECKAAVLTILQSAFLSAGQRCTCARRLLVPETTEGSQLLEELIETMQTLEVKGQFEVPEPFYSGLVTQQAALKLLEAQQDLEARGARVLVRMKLLEEGTSLVSPGLIDVTGIDVPDEEYFGPLLKVSRYRDWDSAIDEANNTRFGLAAGLIGGTRDDWNDFVLRVRAGIVNWNRQTTGAASDSPFGGIGDSGNHRPSAYFAADYCAYPVASMEADIIELPNQLPPGVTL